MRTNKLNFRLKVLMLIVFTSFLLSCNSNHKESLAVDNVELSEKHEAIAIEGMDSETLSPSQETLSQEIPKALKIIKSASVKYKVVEVKGASKRINKIVQQFNGYLSDQRFENNLYRKENRFTIKVPNQYFALLLDSIVNVAEFIDYENITTDDVTEEYVDLQSRLKTKLEVKQRYETILRKSAKTVKDILATEERLGIIQEEIEIVQGRLNFLSNKVSYSTIQVELYETVDYKEEPESYSRTFFSKVKEGFLYGWHLISSILLGMIYIWPILLIGFLIFFILKKRFR